MCAKDLTADRKHTHENLLSVCSPHEIRKAIHMCHAKRKIPNFSTFPLFLFQLLSSFSHKSM